MANHHQSQRRNVLLPSRALGGGSLPLSGLRRAGGWIRRSWLVGTALVARAHRGRVGSTLPAGLHGWRKGFGLDLPLEEGKGGKEAKDGGNQH
jgi:hypothetical protein